eukprot:6009295-Amphidinium_carterae.1
MEAKTEAISAQILPELVPTAVKLPEEGKGAWTPNGDSILMICDTTSSLRGSAVPRYGLFS